MGKTEEPLIPDVARIGAADRRAREVVAQAQEEARGLKSQAEARVQESRQATAQEISRLEEQHRARGEEAAAFLVSRVLGP
jgi:hypothetical protein